MKPFYEDEPEYSWISNLNLHARWKVYNLAFRVFGNTWVWPKIAFKTW